MTMHEHSRLVSVRVVYCIHMAAEDVIKVLMRAVAPSF